MTWEEYYEKIWEWKPSTMVKYMSKLSDFGPSEEVMEAIIEISFGDTKGATRMLKKAIDAGVKFLMICENFMKMIGKKTKRMLMKKN